MATAAMPSAGVGSFLDSIERDDLDVIEATLSWGGDVLAVRHLPAGSAISVGEAPGCTFFVPAEQLGADSIEVLAAGTAELRQDQPIERALGAFTVHLRLVAAGRNIPLAGWDNLKEGALGAVGASLAVHAMILGSLAMFLPALAESDDDAIQRDQIVAMQKYLVGAAEREHDQVVETATGRESGGESGTAGQQAPGESGAIGSRTAPKTQGHWSVRGDANPRDATLSHQEAREMARDFGLLGLLNTARLSDPNAPAVPWDGETRGADPESHRGAMWGPDAAENWGTGGLSLEGAGEGGCLPGDSHCGEGIGLRNFGGFGHNMTGHFGPCAGPNCKDGMGVGHGPNHGAHVPTALRMRMCGEQACGFETTGRIPPEVIQRIVRQNAGRYRLCYEKGLAGNPGLTGHVRVKFVIDRTGAVSTAQDGGSDIPDESVRACVVQTFYALTFPQPEGGVVRVTYPIIFTPE